MDAEAAQCPNGEATSAEIVQIASPLKTKQQSLTCIQTPERPYKNISL